jgi:hypothetical protein
LDFLDGDAITMESFEGLGEVVVSRERESFRNSDDADGESIE